jgi:tripartite-type tricarboxylate transporter receptor subunit TctC
MTMMSRRNVILVALTCATAASSGEQAVGQTPAWPSQTVRVITFGPPGAAPDLASRMWVEKLGKRWGKAAIVENKPGADGILAVRALLAARDGHTLFFGPHFIYSTLHNTKSDLELRPRDEMIPICGTNLDFIGVAVSPKVPVSSLAELKDYVRAHPERMNWWAPQGSTLSLLMREFIASGGLRMTYVPYRGGPEAISDLIEDRLQVAMMPLAPLVGQVNAGKARLLATNGTQRPTAAATIPTATEQGFADMTIDGVFGFYAPKSATAEFIARIEADVREAAAEADLPERFERIGQKLRFSSRTDFTAELSGYERKFAELAQRHKDKTE